MPDDMSDEQKIHTAIEVVAKDLFEDSPQATRAAVVYLLGRFLADVNDIASSIGCIASIMIDQSEAFEMNEHLRAAEPEGNA